MAASSSGWVPAGRLPLCGSPRARCALACVEHRASSANLRGGFHQFGHGVGDSVELALGLAHLGDADPLAGPVEQPGGNEGALDADDELGAGTLDGAAEAGRAEPGVGHHDDGAELQAGVNQAGQFDAGRDQQVDPVARLDADPGESVGQQVHLPGELGPGQRPRPGAGGGQGRHVDDGGGVVRAALVELGEHRAEGLRLTRSLALACVG